MMSKTWCYQWTGMFKHQLYVNRTYLCAFKKSKRFKTNIYSWCKNDTKEKEKNIVEAFQRATKYTWTIKTFFRMRYVGS